MKTTISIPLATDNPVITSQLVKIRPRTAEHITKTRVKPKVKRARVWAVDFDGTLCKNRYPEIGEPNMDLIEALKMAQYGGNVKLILWTCREHERLREAIDWCDSYGLNFDAVNENLPEEKELWQDDPRKIGADLYIDDRGFPFWGTGKVGSAERLLSLM